MQRSLLLIILLNYSLNLKSAQDDKTAPETLHKIAGLVGNFGKILAQPNNPAIVSSSICGMISCILGLAADTRGLHMLTKLNQEITETLESGDQIRIQKLQTDLEKICSTQIKSLDQFIQRDL